MLVFTTMGKLEGAYFEKKDVDIEPLRSLSSKQKDAICKELGITKQSCAAYLSTSGQYKDYKVPALFIEKALEVLGQNEKKKVGLNKSLKKIV